MCCAKTCHPGWHDLELTLAVASGGSPSIDKPWEKLFAETRQSLPNKPAPEDWVIKAVSDGTTLRLDLVSPKATFSGHDSIYCFSENNLIHSDKEQIVNLSPDRKTLTFILTKSEFGPANPKMFPALLYHPGTWPGTNQKWIRVSVPIETIE